MSEATSKPAIFANSAERRMLPRQALESLSYVDLGDTNGGIILNVSEGGLAFRAAIPVMEEHIPKLRFQLSGGECAVESEARVAWTADDNRMVGVKFVELQAGAREALKTWIANATNPVAPPDFVAAAPVRRELAPLNIATPVEPAEAIAHLISQIETAVGVGNLHEPTSTKLVELPVALAGSRQASAVAPSAPPVLAPTATVRRVSPSLDGIAIDALLPSVARERSHPTVGSIIAARSSVSSSKNSWKSPSQSAGSDSNFQVRAPLVILLAATIVIAIWFFGRSGPLLPAFSDSASSPDVQSSGPANAAARLVEIKVVDANGRQRQISWDSTRRAAVTSSPAAIAPAPRRETTPIVAEPDDSSLQKQVSADISAAANDDSHSVKQMWSLPHPGQSAAGNPASVQQQAQPPALKQYSSAIPGALPSALSSARLQPPAPEIERLISQPTSPSPRPSSGPHAGVLIRRVDPIYPPRAAAEKIEGVVAMQIVVGKDGKVHSVKILSGPRPLQDAASDAVKLWRYEPAVVDGKLAESRQYVQLVFKLGVH